MSEALGDPRVDHLVSLLRRERSAYELTTTQKLSYVLLHVSTIGCAAFLVLAAGTLIAWKRVLGDDAPSLLLIFLVCSMVLGYLTLVALLLNIPLLIKAAKNRRRLRELGLEPQTSRLWKDKAHSKARVDWLGGIFLILGFLLTVSGVVEGFKLDRAQVYPVAAWLSALGLACIGSFLIRRGRARLEFVKEIAALESVVRDNPALAPDGDGYENLPPDTLEQLRTLERNSIRRERETSILESLSPAGEPQYAVQKSRSVLADQERLPPERRALLESMLQQLMIGPHSAGSTLSRTNSGLTIEYDVDDERRVVRVHAFRESGHAS